MALYSYERQRDEDEANRRAEVIRHNKLTVDSYKMAWRMAEKYRAATARTVETDLQGAKKSYKTAMRLVDKYQAQHGELAERIRTARKEYLLAAEAAVKGEPSYEKMLKARDKYIKLSGKQEAVNRAVIASEAAAAKFQIRRAKTAEHRQVLATRRVADRYLKQEAMEKQFQKTQTTRLAHIKAASGKERKYREEAWTVERKRSLAVIGAYQRETVSMALKYRLGEREMLQDKKRQKAAIWAIAAPRVRAVELAAPGERFMKRRARWGGPLERGKLPRMTAAEVPEFLRYLQMRGPELGMAATDIARMQEQALAGRRAAAGRPGVAFGGEPVEAPAPRFVEPRRAAAPVGIAPAVGVEEDLFARLTRELRQLQRRGVTVVNWNVDGEKIAQIVLREEARDERQQDGVQGAEGGTPQAG
ncbi:MAG: hypothetical protein ACYTKD_32195 [Planctomycetota bacterium]|jgi:hypothetical protein